jgi:cell wall-associated NlpC family hydrolase
MTNMQDAVADAAIALIGVRFRPQGRNPRFGLDCVGLVAAALARAGRPVVVPDCYPQRGGDRAQVAAAIDAMPGMVRIEPEAICPGDILLMEPHATQRHFGIVTVSGIVHADAGLRRVVATPGGPPWPVTGAWRLVEED